MLWGFRVLEGHTVHARGDVCKTTEYQIVMTLIRELSLQLARQLAISYGETTLSDERWAAMRDLERRRVARLRVANPTGAAT